VLLDGRDLTPIVSNAVQSGKGEKSRVSAVYAGRTPSGFYVALKDAPELWEVTPSDSGAKASMETERIQLDGIINDFFFDHSQSHIIGADRNGDCWVIDLDKKSIKKKLNIAGMPHLGSGISWEYKGKRVIATPNLKKGAISIIDTTNWKLIKEIETKGPGFFMRSHEKSRYAFTDVFFGPNKDLVHVIDKETLSIAKTLKPVPGKVSGHVEFTRNGSHALLSIWEDPGELLIYNAETLAIEKRLAMRKPSGKYNVFNKISRSEGTSR
jgi:hypothetical protein